MHKLVEDIRKELGRIEENGLNMNNIDVVGKLVDILKDINEIDGMEGTEMRDYGMDRDYMYRDNGDYGARMRDGRGRYMDGGYTDTRSYGRGGNFINMDPRLWSRLEHIMNDAEMYEYGRDKYRGGGGEERMIDGLEKLMYSVCTFVESMMDFAETPQEKEVIRKHVQKLSKM